MTANLHPDDAPPPAAADETLARLDEDLARPSLDPRYRGAYIGRALARHTRTATDLIAAPPPAAELLPALAALYPSELAADLDRNRDLAREVALLEALREGFLESPGGLVRYRGAVYRRGQLPVVIATAKAELDASSRALRDHDRRCRAAALAAAAHAGAGWTDHLRALVALLHYAEHAEADLDDAVGAFGNVLAVITADGRVTEEEAERALAAAHEVYEALQRIHGSAGEVALGDDVAARLGYDSWAECLGPLDLPSPDGENLGEWMRVLDSWSGSAVRELRRLRNAALDELLAAEAHVADVARGAATARPAPVTARVPARYATLPEGAERERQTKLGWWDRFQIADGFVPGALRLVVAAAIVGAVVLGARGATP